MEEENYYLVSAYLSGLDDEENKFIKEQMKKKLSGGGALDKEDLSIDVPTAYIIYAARKGGIVKNLKLKNEKGRAIKTMTEKELATYSEQNEADVKKLFEILQKGEIYIGLTPAGWQETFKELMQSDI